jgi:carboxylate-amine ligase
MTVAHRASATGTATATARGDHRLSTRVEEEFLLLDRDTGVNLGVSERVVAALPQTVRGHSRLELRRSMIKMVTPMETDLATLRRALLRHRRTAAVAARTVGANLVAVGATPVDEPHPAVPASPRFYEMARRFGPVAADPALCSCHIHVGVPDRELAVRVCNRLRVWLPVVQALSANSPFYTGLDTGHASWRSIQLQRWPGVGPTPHFDSVADYDATVAALVTSGVMIDDVMVSWYARPSRTRPAVEIRAGDVCLTAQDTLLLTALVRALVSTAIDDELAGIPAPAVRDCLVSAAHWRAAHDGLEALLLDLRVDALRPAWHVVDELMATVSPALLRSGDLELVVTELARLRRQGTGATRQRRLLQRMGDLPAVLARMGQRIAQ